MKKIEIVLKGVGEGLLMNSAQNMEETSAKKNPTKTYNKQVEAEKVAYKNSKGQLIIPARCMKASILNAGGWYKVGKRSMKPILAGTTRLNPSELILLDSKGKPLTKYDIDTRPVVVGRARILRHRPCIKNWAVKFEIYYDEEYLGEQAIEDLHKIVVDAGKRIGVLDNRPQKYGENGCFEVVKFLPKK